MANMAVVVVMVSLLGVAGWRRKCLAHIGGSGDCNVVAKNGSGTVVVKVMGFLL